MLIADVLSSGINEVREAWQSQRKSFTAEFFEADPCTVSFFCYIHFLNVLLCVYEDVHVDLCFSLRN